MGSVTVGLTSVAMACGDGAPSPLLVTSPSPEPARVDVSLQARALEVGKETRATASVFDASGNPLTNATVTWSSSAPQVATVSESGAIVAVGAGRAAIIATSKNASGSDTLVVTAPVPPPVTRRVASVSVSAQSSQLRVGQTTQASAVARDSAGAVIEGRPVLWSVDSGTVTVATVSSNGTVTAIAAGTAIIRATIDSAFATTAVTVTSVSVPPTPGPIRSVTVALALDTLNIGQSTLAIATARDSTGAVVSGAAVTWSVDSASSVASVTSQGLVTAAAAGVAVIRATAGGIGGTALLTVRPGITPPPQTGNSTVPLLVQRLTAGTGPVLVTNAIPLKPGMLFSNGLGNVALWINGVEVPTAVAATAGSHKDGSLRSVLVQTTYDVPAAGVAGTLQLGAARTQTATLAAPVGVPLAVALPTDATYLMATGLVGPTQSVATVKGLGGAWLKYETDFVKYADQHWTQTADSWSGDYYDRVQIYYAWWVRTGNPEYWRRGTLMAVNYRTNYLELNNYGASHHWAQLEGLALHYWLTGDPLSQKAVGRTAEILSSYYRKGALGDINHIDMESRIQARSLLGFLLAWEIQASGATYYTSSSWATQLPQMLTQILKAQNANGAFYWNGYCGASINYMNAILNDVMIRYYERFQADSRIPASIKANADYLWATQWRSDGSFNYQSVQCNRPGDTGGPSATPDLTGLFTTTYGWLYQQTGNASYRTAADQVFTQGVNQAFLAGTKQFNQEYTQSYKYFFYRQ